MTGNTKIPVNHEGMAQVMSDATKSDGFRLGAALAFYTSHGADHLEITKTDFMWIVTATKNGEPLGQATTAVVTLTPSAIADGRSKDATEGQLLKLPVTKHILS
jgi:hypothetical protein